MIEQDIFVGIVAMATGLFIVLSAASNTGWVNRFWLSRRLKGSSDNSVSRMVILGIGILCTFLGILLLMGFFPGDQSRGNSPIRSKGDKNGDLTPGRSLPAVD